jgi:hypothetical protein
MTLEKKQEIILEIIDLLMSNFSIEFINIFLAENDLAVIEEDSPNQEYDLYFLFKYQADELVLQIKEILEGKLAEGKKKELTQKIVATLMAFCPNNIISKLLDTYKYNSNQKQPTFCNSKPYLSTRAISSQGIATNRKAAPNCSS